MNIVDQYNNQRGDQVTITETAEGYRAWNNEWAVDMGTAQTVLEARILAEGDAQELSDC